MPATVSAIFEDALQLSDDSRVELAERLIASANTPAALLEEQTQVALRRMRALDEGRSSEVPGKDAHAWVRQALRR